MKNKKLKVSLVQTDIVWENAAKNKKLFEKKIGNCSDSDLIILPEMFTTGFSMNPEKLAETMDTEPGYAASWRELPGNPSSDEGEPRREKWP